MKILNYTGKRVGITNTDGRPIEVIAPMGNAHCDIENKQKILIGRTPIYETHYGRVNGLLGPDPNLEKMYIVNADVAEAFGGTRRDLIVPTEPFQYEGATFYKVLRRTS